MPVDALLVVDLGVSSMPHAVFTVIHLAILAVAVVLGIRAGKAHSKRAAAWAYTLIAVGEVSYIGYHVEQTTFLLSHTLSEVLVLGAIVLFFGALARERGPVRR